jgi:NAD(P)-dependent dehydrogenase (short-subunit alcohol dehydrogenase family)
VLADVSEEAVRAEAQKLAGAGHRALAIRCDVTDDAEVAGMVERTVAQFGRLDAAFNNAASWLGSHRSLTAAATSGTV